MSISVALCTYNGELHLLAQLESIAAQTRPPDELIVCDDNSHDNTLAILEAFAKQAGFPVHITRNQENLRSTANFAQAIGLCQGDLVALCDQDDVWHPEKLEVLAAALEGNCAAGLAFSDAKLVNEALQPLQLTAWQSIDLHSRKRQWIEEGQAHRVFLSQYVVTGATMMFRSRYKELFLPVPESWVHDAWISLLLAAIAPVVIVERPLIDYRQHTQQQIGLRRLGFWGLYRLAIARKGTSFQALRDQFGLALERLQDHPRADMRFLYGLEKKLEHLERRHALRQTGIKRYPAILAEALRGDYARYSYGWKSVLQDLCF